jgi:hypothetical protein
MPVFQHILWGYELTYPDDWVHQVVQDADGFAAIPEALDSEYFGPDAGQVMVRGEWNWARQPVEPFWNRHIGMLAGMLGAKQVGAAPWRIRNATGIEAEIVLPKRDNRRLWAGILARDFRILHFMVTHPKEDRQRFDPLATAIISSLRFPNRFLGIKQTRDGLPLPPGYTPVDPQSVIHDIADPQHWQAYDGQAGIGALQAFYLRESPIHDWEIDEYVPFPSSSDLGFARLSMHRADQRVTLGILPFDTGKVTSSSPGKLVIKVTQA